jgi:hypothetical protein
VIPKGFKPTIKNGKAPALPPIGANGSPGPLLE